MATRKHQFLFDTFEASIVGYNRAKSIDPTAEWLGDLRGDGYVVSCTTPGAWFVCRVFGGKPRRSGRPKK